MKSRHLAWLALATLLGTAVSSAAQLATSEQPVDADAVVPVYPGVAPGSESWTWHEEVAVPPWGGRGGRLVRNVVQPTLTVFKPVNPSRQTHTAVIVSPGGGFRWLSIDSEGYEVARALAARGVTAFVLKYRLQHTADDEGAWRKEAMDFVRSVSQAPKPAKGDKQALPPAVGKISVSPSDNPGIADGIAAVRYVRTHASEYGIDPQRIGMVGFSAGGGVTCGTVLHGDADTRLNFAAPIYGAFNSSTWPASTPPLFLAVAGDDVLASPGEINTFLALRDQGLPVELHVFEKGGHGFGMTQLGVTTDGWFEELVGWLSSKGFMTP